VPGFVCSGRLPGHVLPEAQAGLWKLEIDSLAHQAMAPHPRRPRRISKDRKIFVDGREGETLGSCEPGIVYMYAPEPPPCLLSLWLSLQCQTPDTPNSLPP